ncbi:MAG TPA: hypothetical protein VF134_03070 [Candidatus Dormibacteraeota bacterium]
MTLRRALLGAAAAGYCVAAWAVAPGFFDGFAPPEPYRWEHPPPSVKNNPGPPLAGHATFKVASNGQVDPGSVFTGETQPQASASFLPGSFPPPSNGVVSLDIKPEASGYPDPTGLTCATNIYLFSSSAALQKDAVVTLRYSDAVPAPSDIYRAPQSGGGWTKLGSTGANAPFYIAVRTTQLGYFAACYETSSVASAAGTRVGGNQTLPIIVALGILLVVLGGIPLAFLRRRAAAEEPSTWPPRTGGRRPGSGTGGASRGSRRGR